MFAVIIRKTTSFYITDLCVQTNKNLENITVLDRKEMYTGSLIKKQKFSHCPSEGEKNNFVTVV